MAGRLIGAFVLGTVVMGGGLYFLDHTGGAKGGPKRGLDSRAVPGADASAPAGESAPATRLGGGAAAKASAGLAEGAIPSAPNAGAAKPLPQAPFGESEEVFETGAKVYVAHCASCHGQPGKSGSAGGQFWGAGAAAVVAEPVGLIFQQTATGVPPGMKGYRGQLPETAMWDMALLLHNATEELPDPVMRILHGRPGR